MPYLLLVGLSLVFVGCSLPAAEPNASPGADAGSGKADSVWTHDVQLHWGGPSYGEGIPFETVVRPQVMSYDDQTVHIKTTQVRFTVPDGHVTDIAVHDTIASGFGFLLTYYDERDGRWKRPFDKVLSYSSQQPEGLPYTSVTIDTRRDYLDRGAVNFAGAGSSDLNLDDIEELLPDGDILFQIRVFPRYNFWAWDEGYYDVVVTGKLR